MSLLVAPLALLGLLVGSFLNVVVSRVPAGESVVHPPSRCPTCGSRIRPWDNVPVLSWLVLRGRCRDCGTRISARYPAVEAATAVLFALVALLVGPWAVPAFAYLAAIGVALALIDLDTHRLPNAIVLPSYPVLGALLALASWGTGDWSALLRAVIGGTALWVAYFALCLAKPGGMGFGDVKLAGLLGGALAWLGWGPFAVGAFGAFVLGGLFAVVLLVTGRAGRGSGIPFGPWMLLGAGLGVAVGEPLWGAYLGLLV
ncbi:prepilin peptidase [Cellulomonas aerilata]|uniref:Prepilin leader peptidase/N-methyltransferase n=1 Tax=Cellulomonas aerilata TaxID=515326 RepID=A0A512DA89_9CELL|nr:A24 family peptidase [Cellulomonas aerilata]GEO33404.1 prepilin peptidase [Cellulomonas aerilata]